MTESQATADVFLQTRTMMRQKLGIKAPNMARAVAKAKSRIPSKIYARAMVLATAEPLMAHPKLRMTLDQTAMKLAAEDVQNYLKTIDLADRRKGWLLGMLGGLAFNMILFVVVLVIVLYWRGFF